MVEVAPPIVDILIHLDPALDYGPDWMPAPNPPVDIPILTARGSWSDVFDWVKSHAILPRGKPIDDPFGTLAAADQMMQRYAGETLKALSGFMNRATAMTVQAAAILEKYSDNIAANELSDFHDLSVRLDRIENVQNYIVSQVIPAVEAQFAAADHKALIYALDAEQAAQSWTQNHVLVPLVESLGSLETRMTQVINLKAEESHQISAQQVAGLGAVLLPAIAAVAAKAASVANWVDSCGAPMCDTMGPKTDLGKLLKLLKIGAAAALLAELAALNADTLEKRMAEAVGLVERIVSEFQVFFGGTGETLGGVLSHLGA